MDTTWQSYEEVAAYLLNKFAEEFGLSRVEGKQSVSGIRSGTNWAIDAKGFRQGSEGFVIIECRRYTTTKQNQEKVGALAYRIAVTPISFDVVNNVEKSFRYGTMSALAPPALQMPNSRSNGRAVSTEQFERLVLTRRSPGR